MRFTFSASLRGFMFVIIITKSAYFLFGNKSFVQIIIFQKYGYLRHYHLVRIPLRHKYRYMLCNYNDATYKKRKKYTTPPRFVLYSATYKIRNLLPEKLLIIFPEVDFVLNRYLRLWATRAIPPLNCLHAKMFHR